jgi:hypothetical protein
MGPELLQGLFALSARVTTQWSLRRHVVLLCDRGQNIITYAKRNKSPSCAVGPQLTFYLGVGRTGPAQGVACSYFMRRIMATRVAYQLFSLSFFIKEHTAYFHHFILVM